MRKAIYFLGPQFSGSTYIRNVLTYAVKSYRGLKGTGDRKNGDGACCEKTLGYSKFNWVPKHLIDGIVDFNDIYILNSHFIDCLDMHNPNNNNFRFVDLNVVMGNTYKMQIIRNPIESIISGFMNRTGIQTFGDDFISKMIPDFNYYFSEKKKFSTFPIKNRFDLSYYNFMNKDKQKDELARLLKFLGLNDLGHLSKYIEDEYDILKDHIYSNYLEARGGIKKTNTMKQDKNRSRLTSEQYEMMLAKIKESCIVYKLDQETIDAINYEIESEYN